MRDAWKTLLAAGVPLGAARPKPTHLDARGLRAAIKGIELDQLSEREREAVHAWLRVFHRQWPSGFERVLGGAGRALLEELDALPFDPNRYLKLKRIAAENLSELV